MLLGELNYPTQYHYKDVDWVGKIIKEGKFDVEIILECQHR